MSYKLTLDACVALAGTEEIGSNGDGKAELVGDGEDAVDSSRAASISSARRISTARQRVEADGETMVGQPDGVRAVVLAAAAISVAGE